MSDDRKRVLDMLDAKKISVEEAMRLLEAVEHLDPASPETSQPTQRPIRYLRVLADSPSNNGNTESSNKINIRIPVALIRAGMKFTSLIPSEASDQIETALKEKGVSLNLKNLKDLNTEELIQALAELEVNVDGKEKVRVFAE